MSPATVTIILLLGLTLSVFNVNGWSKEWIDNLDSKGDGEETDLKSFIKILSKPQVLDRYKLHKIGDNPLLQFDFKNCGSPNDILQISKVSVSPDPVKLPGSITASFTAKILRNITAPLTAQLSVKKKIFGSYLSIPCINNVGSCTYKDLCSMILIKPGQQCPASFQKYKLPCTCPFHAGSYTVPKVTMKVGKVKLPSSLVNGDYKIKVNLMHKDTRVGCYEVKASLVI